jgi:predicted MFS family arabinose efflux permease
MSDSNCPTAPDAKSASWDGAAAVTACIAACVAAYGVYLGLPLILGALADTFGFDNRQIGWIGSAENLGLLLGAAGVSLLARTRRFRRVALAGVALAVTGDALTLLVGSFPAFCGIRLVAGLGSGLCYSSAVASLSLTERSARNFSIFIAVLVIANSLELWLLPAVVTHWGVHGVYTALGALYAAPALLLWFIPASIGPQASDARQAAEAVVAQQPVFTRLAWWCLAAIVMFNIAASAFWAYSERIGTWIGLTETAVANTLTICNLVSLTGSALAYWLSRYWGQHRPQLGALVVMIAVYATWAFGLSPLRYVVGVLLFFEVWSMASVYQLSTLTSIDRVGRYVALVPAAQGIGQSAGPFIAGLLLGWRLTFPQILMAVTLFAVGCLATYSTVYVRLRRIHPELADGVDAAPASGSKPSR